MKGKNFCATNNAEFTNSNHNAPNKRIVSIIKVHPMKQNDDRGQAHLDLKKGDKMKSKGK